MTFRPLTARQREVLDELEVFVDERGYPPTLEELSAACGLGGPTGARRMLDVLERKGYLRRPRGRKRAYRLAEPELDVARLCDDDVVLLAVMTACHREARDAELDAARWVNDEDVREGLLRDALARQQLVTRVTAQVPDVDSVPIAADAAGLIADGLERSSPWPALAVGLLVFDRLTVAGATAITGQVPHLEPSLRRSARTSAHAALSARGWVRHSLRSGADGARLENLRRRAAAMARCCEEVKAVLAVRRPPGP